MSYDPFGISGLYAGNAPFSYGAMPSLASRLPQTFAGWQSYGANFGAPSFPYAAGAGTSIVEPGLSAATPVADRLAASLGPAANATRTATAAEAGNTATGFAKSWGSRLAEAGAPEAAAARGSWLGGLGEGVAGGTGLLAKGAQFVRGPAGPSLAGWAAAQGINKLLPSTEGTQGNVREALADAAVGAGIGGSVGLAGGPFAPVSVPVGVGVGTALGLGYGLVQDFGLLGGDEDASAKDLRKMLESNAQQLGVGPTSYTTAFDAAVKTGMKDADGKEMSKKDIAALLTSQMQQEVVTSRAQKEQSAQALEFHKADLANNLAMQTQAQQFMSPYVNNIISGGASQAAVLNKLADQMPAEYKGVFQAQAANALSTSQQIGGAYMAQMAIQPTMQIMQGYQDQQQKMQSDMLRSLTMAQQIKSQQGAGGGTDFSGLVNTP